MAVSSRQWRINYKQILLGSGKQTITTIALISYIILVKLQNLTDEQLRPEMPVLYCNEI